MPRVRAGCPTRLDEPGRFKLLSAVTGHSKTMACPTRLVELGRPLENVVNAIYNNSRFYTPSVFLRS